MLIDALVAKVTRWREDKPHSVYTEWCLPYRRYPIGLRANNRILTSRFVGEGRNRGRGKTPTAQRERLERVARELQANLADPDEFRVCQELADRR